MMKVGDTLFCDDVNLADVTHQLHKDGYKIQCEKVGKRRYKFEIIGKNERPSVELEDDD